MKHIFNKIILPLLLLTAIIGLQSCHDDDDDDYNPLVGTVWIHYDQPNENEKITYQGIESNATIAYFTEDHLEIYPLDTNLKIIDRMERFPYDIKDGHLYIGEKDWRHEIKWDHYYLGYRDMRRCNAKFEDFLKK